MILQVFWYFFKISNFLKFCQNNFDWTFKKSATHFFGLKLIFLRGWICPFNLLVSPTHLLLKEMDRWNHIRPSSNQKSFKLNKLIIWAEHCHHCCLLWSLSCFDMRWASVETQLGWFRIGTEGEGGLVETWGKYRVVSQPLFRLQY